MHGLVVFMLAGNDRPALSWFRGGAFWLRSGMRQRRLLGERPANATMLSRLAAANSVGII